MLGLLRAASLTGRQDLRRVADGVLGSPALDGDRFADGSDNCSAASNASQLDTNLDGFGNACDADYDNTGTVASPDFGILSIAYGSLPGDPNYIVAYNGSSACCQKARTRLGRRRMRRKARRAGELS